METDNDLQLLQQKITQKKHLEAKLSELRGQRSVFERNVISLRVALRQEQEDVEKLEEKSLSHYFLQVVGKLDDKLDQERKDVYAAKIKLNAAEQELSAIEEDIDAVKNALGEIYVAEVTFRETLDKKRAALRFSGTEKGTKYLELEQRLAQLQAQKKEVKEAVSAGCSAKGTAQRILGQLDDAGNWNTWDLIGGGGIITHVAKYSHLDEAQDLVQELQSKLRRFKTELADISISADMQVSIDGFLRFADYFFDGLFADWAVGSRINQAASAVESTINRIDQMMKKLNAIEYEIDSNIDSLKKNMDTLIMEQ